MTSKSQRPLPPDHDDRQRIVSQLDDSMFVEAAAGTGKTSSLIDRMVALIREGRCQVGQMAAVTFTRKATAEIRARFQLALEQAATDATGRRQIRLRQALEQIERCFVGTIHALCARLLRERPVEAGLDVELREADESLDSQLRARAWRQYVDSLLADDAPILEELEQLGLRVSRSTRRGAKLVDELEELNLDLAQLGPAFCDMAEYPDIEDWPASRVPMPDLASVRPEIEAYCRHIGSLELERLDPGRDRLIVKLLQLRRLAQHVDLDRPGGVMEVLEHFEGGDPTLVQRNWKRDKSQAKLELQRWRDFRDQRAEPLLHLWRQHRYEPVIRAIRPAMEVYDQLRAEAQVLNFQDLLLRARDLVRDHPAVRTYFRRRFTHLLVDEFQDTDPIQAELMMLLTADDPAQTQWRLCRPVPGSLFVVGDPKQSIYRFRRADIQTYAAVQDILARHGKRVCLSTNFRSSEPLIAWLNGAFDEVFPPERTAEQAAAQPLEHCPQDDSRGDGSGGNDAGDPPVAVLPADESLSKRRCAQWEAAWVAGTIRGLLDSRPDCRPSDFLILARTRDRLSVYAAALQRLGVPHEVTGGNAVNDVPELRLLHTALLAASRPHDGLALLAALRGELFGVADDTLYAFRAAGGRFTIHSPIPDSLTAQQSGPLRDALGKLSRYAAWLQRLPLAAAVERMADDLGLLARAAAAPDGAARAGALCKALQLLREGSREGPAEDLRQRLAALVEGQETHDGVSARPPSQAPVRVMNLHQAKGLEARCVFLVDATGPRRPPAVRLHVDRTGPRNCGYLAVYSGQQTQWQRRKLLACPPDWNRLASRERQFLDAEEQRLLYVAATRAGTRLVISARDAQNNPWRFFHRHVQSCQPLDEPPAELFAGCDAAGENLPQDAESVAVEAAAAAREARWRQCLAPTYRVSAAKELALQQSLRQAGYKPHGKDAHGEAWGSVIHSVLEALMRNPGADCTPVARSALDQYGLEQTLADEVVEAVEGVVKSTLWQRALASAQRLVEVPFAAPLPRALPRALQSAAGSELPTVLRGVIDLVFREPQGWVLVDYKSDRVELIELPVLAKYYAPQIDCYAAAWAEMTAEPVAERGLLFTHHGRYLQL